MGVLPPILIWPAAAVLAGLAVVLILMFSARAARDAATAGEDPARAVYRRQLHDIDDLAERGLLQADELQAAHAEAARRLLAEPAEARPERVGPGWLPAAAAGIAALVALGLYLRLGSPSTPDQPFKARLAAWRTTPVNQLRPDEIAAALKDSAKTHPNDARLLGLLGKIEMQQGDAAAATLDFEKAAALEPNDADLQVALAQAAATAAGQKPSPEAETALNRALTLDPKNPSALYLLGVVKASDG